MAKVLGRVVLLFLGSLQLIDASNESIENLPFTFITSPSHFECLKSNFIENFLVDLDIGSDTDVDVGSKVCIQVDGGHFAEKVCNSLNTKVYIPNNLTEGCHVLLSWWESADGLQVGSAHSVIVQVPDSQTGQCHDTCTDKMATSPNIVTGGCDHSDSNHDKCCSKGCCEFVNIASRCSQFSDGLPSCASCMRYTTKPSNNSILAKQLFPTSHGWEVVSFYLELMKNTILDAIFRPSPAKVDGHVWPDAETSQSLSMVGKRRLDHIQSLVEDVILRQVPGDFAECGCWRGGVAALVTAIFKSANQLKTSPPTSWAVPVQQPSNDASKWEAGLERGEGRIVWLLDSFQGLPSIDLASFPGDSPHVFEAALANSDVLSENSVEAVINSFKKLDLFNEFGTRFVQGFFKESIPVALARGDLRSLSILRLDGDLYESTIQALHYLYASVSIGGHVVIDDFTDWVGCRRATNDFRLVHNIQEPIEVVWHDVLKGEQVRGVWWTKLRQAEGYSKYLKLKPEDYFTIAAQLRKERSSM